MKNKVPFEITEIRISKSMGGFGIDIFLKSNRQLKGRFEDSEKYEKAIKTNGNLTLLKYIFKDYIDNILKENSDYFYVYSTCEMFDKLWLDLINQEIDSKDIYNDSMNILRSCAVEKNIEFDGYFQKRWEESADTIINFDEDYFEDEDRRDLYIFLSAMVDSEIFKNLKIIFLHLFQIEITKEFLEDKTSDLIKVKGVKF